MNSPVCTSHYAETPKDSSTQHLEQRMYTGSAAHMLPEHLPPGLPEPEDRKNPESPLAFAIACHRSRKKRTFETFGDARKSRLFMLSRKTRSSGKT